MTYTLHTPVPNGPKFTRFTQDLTREWKRFHETVVEELSQCSWEYAQAVATLDSPFQHRRDGDLHTMRLVFADSMDVWRAHAALESVLPVRYEAMTNGAPHAPKEFPTPPLKRSFLNRLDVDGDALVLTGDYALAMARLVREASSKPPQTPGPLERLRGKLEGREDAEVKL